MNGLLAISTFVVVTGMSVQPPWHRVAAVGTPTPLTQDATVQPMPNYDVATSCAKSQYAMFGEDFCYKMHYMNREATSDIWLRTSAQVRAECIAAANRFSDYGMLAGCIRSHAKDDRVQ